MSEPAQRFQLGINFEVQADLIAMAWTQFQPSGSYPIYTEFRSLVYEALQ